MKLAAWLVIAAACAETACACKGSSNGVGTGPGTGNATNDPAACDGHAERVRAMYEAGGGLTAIEVADDVALVLGECKAAPAKVAPCLARASTIAQLERDCLPALDDDGREGQVFLTR